MAQSRWAPRDRGQTAPAVARGALDRSGRPPGAPVGSNASARLLTSRERSIVPAARPASSLHVGDGSLRHQALNRLDDDPLDPSALDASLIDQSRRQCFDRAPVRQQHLSLSDQRSAADRGHSRSAVADRRTRRQRAADRRQRRNTLLRTDQSSRPDRGPQRWIASRRRLRDKCRPAPPSMACSAARGRRWATSDSRCSLRRWRRSPFGPISQ